VAALLSCSQLVEDNSATVVEAASRSLNAAPVEVLSVETYEHIYQGSISRTREVIVRVQDFGQGQIKDVTLYGELEDGQWVGLTGAADIEYVGPAGSGFDLYKIYKSDFIQTYSMNWADEFVVKYDSPNGTFWDNNNGANFTVDYNDGMYLDPSAGNLRVGDYWVSSNLDFSGSLWGRVFVRNIAPNKTVKLVYTTDAWATSDVGYAVYKPYYNVGYAPNIINPNDHGVERWEFNIQLPAGFDKADLEFAVEYTAEGVGTFWDNNFGNNYAE
jgi:predicted Zn-dependent protease with MMP-like domain